MQAVNKGEILLWAPPIRGGVSPPPSAWGVSKGEGCFSTPEKGKGNKGVSLGPPLIPREEV